MGVAGIRIQKSALPNKPTRCLMGCVYAEDETCDAPRTNKGNSDACCHKASNRDLLAALKRWNPELKTKG